MLRSRVLHMVHHVIRPIIKLFSHSLLSHVVVQLFHLLYYYSSHTWTNTYWMGVPIRKCPFDMWMYQEILYDIRPDLIIETGTLYGGSASYIACLCDLIKNGTVVTIDIEHRSGRPEHERITYLTGSSIAPEIVEQVQILIAGKERVLVILDSDHSMQHVIEELRIYSQFVSLGSYIIVEDSNINAHPVQPRFGPGPMEALKIFMHSTSSFVIDSAKEKFYLSFNPNGFLKRVR